MIDNLVITSNSGKYEYVRNAFSEFNTIKDGRMKTLVTNAATGEKKSDEFVYIQKKWTCSVRFVAENGEILSSRKVAGYGTASAPAAPAKEGYTFKGWNKSLTGIITDSVFYPIYEIKNSSGTDNPDVPELPDKPGEPEKGKGKGCGGSVVSASLLSVAALAAAAAVIWRERRK